jgi:hypothetical protein
MEYPHLPKFDDWYWNKGEFAPDKGYDPSIHGSTNNEIMVAFCKQTEGLHIARSLAQETDYINNLPPEVRGRYLTGDWTIPTKDEFDKM